MKGELPAPVVPTACERLAQSRERLQLALLAGATTDQTGQPAADWRDGLKSIPGFSLAMKLAKSWWARHPYRLAASVVGEVARAAVLPTAQRHPVGLVAGAFLVGGLLAWSRPWRWLPASALFAGLLAKVIAPSATCQSNAPSRSADNGTTKSPHPGPARSP